MKRGDYATAVGILEYEEERLWDALVVAEENASGDDREESRGLRMLRVQHARAMRVVMLEHQERLTTVVGVGVVPVRAPVLSGPARERPATREVMEGRLF